MTNKEAQQILVLGVGNVLLCDEGVGIRVLRELEARYDFGPNVRLVDGGVLGLSLTGTLQEADQVLVIDAVNGGEEPGTVFRFEWEAKPAHIQYKDSLHQIDLMETLGTLPLVGKVPRVVVVGVQYQEIKQWSLELTPPVERAVEPLIELALQELTAMGVRATPKQQAQEVLNVLGNTGQNY